MSERKSLLEAQMDKALPLEEHEAAALRDRLAKMEEQIETLTQNTAFKDRSLQDQQKKIDDQAAEIDALKNQQTSSSTASSTGFASSSVDKWLGFAAVAECVCLPAACFYTGDGLTVGLVILGVLQVMLHICVHDICLRNPADSEPEHHMFAALLCGSAALVTVLGVGAYQFGDNSRALSDVKKTLLKNDAPAKPSFWRKGTEVELCADKKSSENLCGVAIVKDVVLLPAADGVEAREVATLSVISTDTGSLTGKKYPVRGDITIQRSVLPSGKKLDAK